MQPKNEESCQKTIVKRGVNKKSNAYLRGRSSREGHHQQEVSSDELTIPALNRKSMVHGKLLSDGLIKLSSL